MDRQIISTLALEARNKMVEEGAFWVSPQKAIEFATKFLAAVREQESKEAVAEVVYDADYGLSAQRYPGPQMPPGTKLFLHPPVDRSGEAVAWLHEDRPEADVVTTAVKNVWGAFALGKMAAYNIPLFLHPQEEGWISVEDRLPERYTEVLVHPEPTDYCLTAQYGLKKDVLCWQHSDHEHYVGMVKYVCNPTHWQPIPKPPTAKETK